MHFSPALSDWSRIRFRISALEFMATNRYRPKMRYFISTSDSEDEKEWR
jgi:hypothetical protein